MNHLILFASIGGDLADHRRKHRQNVWRGICPTFIAQVISFVIVCAVLVKFAYKPILKILAERRQQIADGLANAEKIKQELARTEAMRLEVLDKANVQATKMIEEARAAAARVREQETQKAVAQAEQIIAKAREATALEHATHVGRFEARSRAAGGAHHQRGHGQDPHRRGSTTAGGGNPAPVGRLMIDRLDT